MSNKKETVIGEGGKKIKIFSRHSADCKFISNESYLKCDCPKWLQHTIAGKLTKVSARCNSYASVVQAAHDLALGLAGKPPAPKPCILTVKKAVEEWLQFREENGSDNLATEAIGRKLTEWCDASSIVYLHELNTARVMEFRGSLPYAKKTSSSLAIYWTIIGGFFSWATGTKRITENPNPDTRIFPQFRIKYKTPEVVPPTDMEVTKVIATISKMVMWDKDLRNLIRLAMLTQRWSGMAIRDTMTLKRSQLDEQNRIKGCRQKTKERFKIRIPAWLASELRALPGDGPYFFWNGLGTGRHLVLRTLRYYRVVFAAAHVAMTSHRFRHFRITELLSKEGWSVDDVANMVGTSPREIRRTYSHWITDGDDRIDAKQEAIWAAQGLDKVGNQKTERVQ